MARTLIKMLDIDGVNLVIIWYMWPSLVPLSKLRTKRDQKDVFWGGNGPFLAFKSAKMAQNWVNLHDISVVHPCRMFAGVFDIPGAPRGAYVLFSQLWAVF